MDVDKILTQIGGYGYFQKRLTLILGTVIFILTFQPLIMVFIGAEVPWKCKPNSTCTVNGTIESTNSHYQDRCKLNRTDWQYVDELTSITSEVGYYWKTAVFTCIVNMTALTHDHILKAVVVDDQLKLLN